MACYVYDYYELSFSFRFHAVRLRVASILLKPPLLGALGLYVLFD